MVNFRPPCSHHWHLTLSWPAGHICPTYKESFQVCWDNSIPLFLHAAIYLEVSLFHWTSQNVFSRETAMYKWYSVQFCYAALHTVSFVHGCFCGKMHSDWFNGIEILQGRWQHGEVGYCYPSGFEKTLCKWDIYVLLVMKGLSICPTAAPRLVSRHRTNGRHVLVPEGDRLLYGGKCCKLLDGQVHRRWIGPILLTGFVPLKLQTTLHVMSFMLSTKCVMPVFVHVNHSFELKLSSADSCRTCFDFVQARHCLFKSTVSALTQEQEDSSGLVALDTLRSFKRPDPPCDIGFHQSKRRKSSSLHSIRENALTSNMPCLQRSYSETEATIKKALQRCEYLSVWLYRPVWHRTAIICVTVQASVAQDLHYLCDCTGQCGTGPPLSVWLYRPVWHRTSIICVIVQASVPQDLHYLTFLNVHYRHLVGPLGWQADCSHCLHRRNVNMNPPVDPRYECSGFS